MDTVEDYKNLESHEKNKTGIVLDGGRSNIFFFEI